MLSFLNIKSNRLEVFCKKVFLNILQSSLKNIKNPHDVAFGLRLQYLCFHKNFAEILRTSILQNADRLLLLTHLLKMKIAAPDKFTQTLQLHALSTIEIQLMLDLLKNCCKCFLLSLVKKHLNEHIIYYRIMCCIPGTWHNFSKVSITVEKFVPVTVEELCQWLLNNRASDC